MTYIFLIFAYILLMGVGMRLCVPNLGFKKAALPEKLPQDFEAKIRAINAESSDDYDFLKRSYEYITTKYKGSRIRTLGNFWVAFQDPINHASGFLPCTSQNYLLRLMLVKSGRFEESDIKLKTVPLNVFIHQYLSVRVVGKWIDVDPWSSYLDIPLGKKKAYFG